MGFETYMVGGKLSDERGREEAHNFNVIRKNSGIFEIIDSAQVVKHELPNIETPEQLVGLENEEALLQVVVLLYQQRNLLECFI